MKSCVRYKTSFCQWRIREFSCSEQLDSRINFIIAALQFGRRQPIYSFSGWNYCCTYRCGILNLIECNWLLVNEIKIYPLITSNCLDVERIVKLGATKVPLTSIHSREQSKTETWTTNVKLEMIVNDSVWNVVITIK